MTLDTSKYDRAVTLLCPTCGNTQFSHHDALDGSNAVLTCSQCGLEILKEDLIRANSENLEAHAREIGQAAVQDIKKELSDSLRKAFGNSKNIKFR
jgi:predicted RNA-binding Zn-ribbon protein involved in translation (DUF1610 family)